MSLQRLGTIVGEIRKVAQNDPISAAQWNLIADAIQEIRTLLQMSTDPHRWAEMVIAELQEDAAADTVDFEIEEMRHNRGSGGLVATGNTWDQTFEPQSGLWLNGERLAFLWDRSEAKWSMIPIVQVHFGKIATGSELAAGGSATMDVWQYNASGVAEASGKQLTIYDWLLKSSSVIAAGKKVIVAQFLQSLRFLCIAAECP